MWWMFHNWDRKRDCYYGRNFFKSSFMNDSYFSIFDSYFSRINRRLRSRISLSKYGKK
jgi:hypothetical protein